MVLILPCRPALLGAGTEWPLAGHFAGSVRGGDSFVAWAGRIGAAEGPERAWRASVCVSRALTGEAPPEPIRAVAWFWDRIEALPPDRLGERRGEDLTVLVVAGDAGGFAVSGVGLGRVYGTIEGYLRTWVAPEHPLLGPPGRPVERPGALRMHRVPATLVAVAEGAPDLEHERLEAVLPWCGVHG